MILWLLSLACLLQAKDSEFEKWMGKETEMWLHLSRPEDALALKAFEELYEANKQHRFQDEGPSKIPLTLHFLSFKGDPLSIEVMESWIQKHPGWNYRCWTDFDCPLPENVERCSPDHFPFLYLRTAFFGAAELAERKRILRFELLYQNGGLVIDKPTLCLQNFEGLHRGYDFFCGLKLPHAPKEGRNLSAGEGVMGARPFHPIVGKMLEQYSMGKKSPRLREAILERVGEDGNIDMVFPAAYFYGNSPFPTLYARSLEPLLPSLSILPKESPEKRSLSLVWFSLAISLLLLSSFLVWKRRKGAN